MSDPPDDLIAWLGDATGGAESLGGKGGSLDRLAKLGFRVPPGFCLTTAAFRTDDSSAVDAALDTAVKRLVSEVRHAGFEPRFAVRSSAVGEDGTAASYAGLHDTELDIPPAGIADAVRRCWASLWSPAAVAYRRRRDLSADDAAMAVVVQALVPAEASAVVFTRNSVTGRDDQILLTSTPGLGEAMVSGTVTPDTYLIDKAARAVLRFEPGEDSRGRPLAADALAALIDMSLEVEAKFGTAVDVEAAFAGDRWYVLQARPITTGAAAPPGAGPGPAAEFSLDAVDAADLEITWERDDMHMPFALTPLAADYITKALGASFNHHYERFGGTQRLEGRVWHGYAYFGFSWNVPAADEDATKARWTEVLRDRIPATAAYWRDDAIPELQRLYASISGVPVDDLAPGALGAAWHDAWATTLRAWQIHFVSIMGPYQVLEDLADQYAAALGPGRDVEALSLVRGSVHELEDVEARIDVLAAMLEASPELARLVATRAADGSTRDDEAWIDRAAILEVSGGSAFVAALDEFLELHGHLGQNHDDLGTASWAEAPGTLFANLARRTAGSGVAPETRLAELRRVAGERADAVRAVLADRPDELARFETTLAHAIDIGYLTEGHNYWIDRMAQARLRALAARIGRRLVREGVLDRAGDVFFLWRDEVAEAIVDGRPRQELVRERRAQHEHQRTVTPPRYVGPVPEDTGPPDRFEAPRIESTEPDVLRGTGASAGIVRGRARVIESQDAFGLVQHGDILVCPASNPSWVPVFTIAGGLVTNTGGVLSHAAVVAREFGLPAVVGVMEATTRIADGRMVEIDGTAGTVRLL